MSGSVQGLFLVLHLGLIPGSTQGPYVMEGIQILADRMEDKHPNPYILSLLQDKLYISDTLSL